MRKLVTSVAVAAVLLVPQLNLMAQSDEALAIIVPGGGTYSRPITTDSTEAQAFFDQGLRFAWGFYFPESIASYQEAARLDPDSPMPHFGLAHAAGPNPNSRYAGLPDDPNGAGLAAIARYPEQFIGKRVATVLSGGNLAAATLRLDSSTKCNTVFISLF